MEETRGERGIAVGDEIRVDVHSAHVIDDHGDALALAVSKDVVEQGGFSCSEKAGQDGNRDL